MRSFRHGCDLLISPHASSFSPCFRTPYLEHSYSIIPRHGQFLLYSGTFHDVQYGASRGIRYTFGAYARNCYCCICDKCLIYVSRISLSNLLSMPLPFIGWSDRQAVVKRCCCFSSSKYTRLIRTPRKVSSNSRSLFHPMPQLPYFMKENSPVFISVLCYL